MGSQRLTAGAHKWGSIVDVCILLLASVVWICMCGIIERSLEVKLPTIWRDEKQSREEA